MSEQGNNNLPAAEPEPADTLPGKPADRGEQARTALERLKQLQATQPVRPQQPRPRTGETASQPVDIDGAIRMLAEACAETTDRFGDVATAMSLWRWLQVRVAQLHAAGLHGLADRWGMVQHALASSAAFTRDEWSPR
jgi:hypothetical protein